MAIEDPQKARIYVMRQPGFWRFNLVVLTKKIDVVDDGTEIGSIAGQRGFLSWEREPGGMTVSVPGETSISLTVEEGRVYYIVVRDVERAASSLGACVFLGHCPTRWSVELKIVDEEKGRKELAKGTPPPAP